MRVRFARVLIVCLAVMAFAMPARGDVVTDWNQTTLTLGGGGAILSRSLAMVHIAMFDAVNSVTPGFHPYAIEVPGAAGASAEAAAASAAYRVLLLRSPAQKPALDAALAASLAAIPDGPAKEQGIAVGAAAAAAIVALRQSDGMQLPNPAYVPGSAPGDYQLTPPAFAPPVNTGAGNWLPFAMTSASQFRPNGPAGLDKKTYARDFEEVRALGSADPATRTPERNLQAQWHIEMAPFQVSRIARAAVVAKGLSLLDSARMFALLAIANMDGTISVFEAKYVFEFWRPVTAIRNADIDGNPDTERDPAWTPYLVTPPHPEYPSAHAVIQGAALGVLEGLLGPHYAFETTSATVPGVVRSFESLGAYVEDGKLARIYGGIHFRTAVEEGAKQGKKLGKWILETQLLPR